MPRLLPSVMQPTRPGLRAAVELALTVAEEGVAVEQSEAEVEELAEHRSHTQMDATKKPLRPRFLLLSLLPGKHLLLAIHGMLLRRATIAGILLSLLKLAGASPRVQQ
jgi:hypothetical protein